MMTLRRSLATLALLLAAVGLVACDAIPASGPVTPGLTDLQQSEQQVLFAPTGPVAGASQEDVVRGFVSAASAATNDYAIAREFLTPEYSLQWDPYSEALIDDGPRRYEQESDRVGEMSIPAVASVSDRGELTPVPPGPNTDVRYEFEQVDGEWRISSAPTGIVIDKSTFTAAWSAHQIYFIGPEGRLVPETRWFLSRASTATQIITELVAGPSEQMLDVLYSAFPAEVSLANNSVPVIDGKARIEVTAELAEASDAVQDDVVRQISASLQAVPGVSEFDLTSSGTLIDEAAVGRTEDSPITTETQGTAVLQDGEFGLITASEVDPIGDLGNTIVSLNPTSVTLSTELDTAVVQASDGITWVSNGSSLKIEGTPRQLEPSLDPFGNVWTYSPENPDTLFVTIPGVQVIEIDAPWLEGINPSAVRVSPDGSRVGAFVPDGQNSSTVVTAGIIRDEDGLPSHTTDTAAPQLWVNGTPLDFDWIDESRFVTLTGTDAGSKVTIGSKGSFPSEAGTVPDGINLSSGGSRTSLRVLDSHGDLYAPQGSGWQQQASGIDLLAKRN